MRIPPESLSFEYFRASGPGGQNVNKVSTAVRLRFDVASAGLAGDVAARLSLLAGKRMTEEGILIIEASRFRTQERNQADALSRLETLLLRAEKPPKKRHKTRPTRASMRKRVEGKKKRGKIKRLRGKVGRDE
ncbi:MAG: aminoacyl-tRNA hydrolase [Anaerolineales bacterium]|uniref:Aminoacyl-tRNA hydrolase n=1 Tax=Candidatus Desulfolinea nitratireducens TaxID=2841698 RepID=A0A8J6NIA1_9CHLR|nr:aminoacyl-tRNA hydrolase [Candidatus Desulfolinea nitratireducens]MBL6961455.1 aminoacyl-tRNA hydrolase [Anaerolineales bacterium]